MSLYQSSKSTAAKAAASPIVAKKLANTKKSGSFKGKSQGVKPITTK